MAAAEPLSVMRPIRHWTDNRKREVLGAIAADLVDKAAVCRLHNISPEELDLWRHQFDPDGGDIGRIYGLDGHSGRYR